MDRSLEQLRIRREDKQRSRAPFAGIVLGILAVSVTVGWFAWPRGSDRSRQIGAGPPAPSTNSTTDPGTTARSSPRPGTNEPARPLLTVTGYIINRERIELSPRFLGVVRWIGVRKGDVVTNGQVVVRLDDAEQQGRVQESEARVASARASLEKAELDYARMQQLIAQNIETKQNGDDVRIRLTASRAQLREAEASLAVNRTYLEWTVIKSPINGVVLEKLADANELVTPQSFGGGRGPSTALVALADPQDLQVETDLSEVDVAKAYLRQPCRVIPEAYPDRQYQGFVAEIAPEASRQKGTLQVKVQIRDPDRFLTPELTARVEFLR